MEELNYMLNNHTEAVFYLVLVVVFGALSLRLLVRQMRKSDEGRRFDD